MTVRRSKKPARLRLDDPKKSGPRAAGAIVAGASIQLDADASDATGDEPKWQHVATAGTFKGYGDGSMPFAFTTDTFNAIVRNFRASPSFEMGPDGTGIADVVQWDFHHASEAPPDEVAQLGAPAQGWVRDLRVQTGPGGSELWALTHWLEPARSYIQEGKYKWASVAVALDAVDPVSGEKIGPLLTSIAITNQPFIEGMNELAASRDVQARAGAERRDGRRVAADYYAAAYSTEEARGSIRRCLGLPITASAADIAQSLMGLLGIVAGGEEAEQQTGVDADEVIGDFRSILGLPLLTPLADVARQALSLFDTEGLGALGGDTETANGDGESVPGSTTTSKRAATAAQPRTRKTEDPMTPEMIALAKKLGVRETPEAVQAAVAGLVDIRDGLIDGLKLDRNISDSRLADVAKNVKKIADQGRALARAIGVIALGLRPDKLVRLGARGDDAANLEDDMDMEDPEADGNPPPAKDPNAKGNALISKLNALFAAGGIEDPDRASAQIVKTLTDAAKLEENMPELEELRKYAKAAKAEEETSSVAATLRNYFNDDEDHKEMVVAFYRRAGKKKFLEKYPPRTEESEGIEATVAAESIHPTRALGAPATKKGESVSAARPSTTALPKDFVNLDDYPGVNPTEQAINAARATVFAGKKDASWEEVCEFAMNQRRSGKYVNLSKQGSRV